MLNTLPVIKLLLKKAMPFEWVFIHWMNEYLFKVEGNYPGS